MDEDTLIATLLKMRDGYERQQVKNALKAKLRKLFGNPDEVDFYLNQIVVAKDYQQRVSRYAGLLSPDARKAMTNYAIKSCDLAMMNALIRDDDRARRLSLEIDILVLDY